MRYQAALHPETVTNLPMQAAIYHCSRFGLTVERELLEILPEILGEFSSLVAEGGGNFHRYLNMLWLAGIGDQPV